MLLPKTSKSFFSASALYAGAVREHKSMRPVRGVGVFRLQCSAVAAADRLSVGGVWRLRWCLPCARLPAGGSRSSAASCCAQRSPDHTQTHALSHLQHQHHQRRTTVLVSLLFRIVERTFDICCVICWLLASSVIQFFELCSQFQSFLNGRICLLLPRMAFHIPIPSHSHAVNSHSFLFLFPIL